VKPFLCQLEGIFRLLPENTKRVDQDLLNGIDQSFRAKGSLESYLAACEDASIFCLGDKKIRRGGFKQAVPGDAQEGGDAPPVEGNAETPLLWHIHVAGSLSRVGLQLQKALMEDKIISLIVEWCETPPARRPGIAYTDTSVLYDVDDNPVKHVTKSPSNDIYLRIPHPLLDPVLEDAEKGLQTFIQTTFWSNLNVYICFMSAIALAKRGENVDRCFIGLSPGGVGQSLFSALLSAMFGSLFGYFDPNIWYQDDEIRKQIENLEGCIILCAQEAPETNRRLREDLYKKTISADGCL